MGYCAGKRSKFVFSILLGCLISIIIGNPGIAAKKTSQKLVTVPVFYVTDRELTGETFGPHRRYPSHCQHHMYYGTAFVDVPNFENKTDPALFKTLSWKESADKSVPKISVKDRIDPSNPAASKTEFFARLRKGLDESGYPDLCLFVHGAADGFEDCLQDAATMAYYLEKPTVLYSWPSDPKRRRYFIDSSNSEWSQGHFNQFCSDLLEFQSQHPILITAVAHSMGNRLIVRALPVVYGKGLFSNWELVSPDIDADTCRHYVMGYKQANATIRLYVSNKDKLLPLAQLITGGYYRLGQAAMPTAPTPALRTAAFERIDFTAIDEGFAGHSIPFALLANIIHSGKPGPGLDLVNETEVHETMLDKFASKSEKFSHESAEADYCKRVVRTK